MKFEVGQKIKFESAELNNGEKEFSFGNITHFEGNKIIGITEDWFEFEIEEKHIVEKLNK